VHDALVSETERRVAMVYLDDLTKPRIDFKLGSERVCATCACFPLWKMKGNLTTDVPVLFIFPCSEKKNALLQLQEPFSFELEK
jgi:hypothetical protein